VIGEVAQNLKPKSTKVVSLEFARHFWLKKQGFSEKPQVENVMAVSRVLENISSVQIDTIHVVERAHHHILWSRLPTYQKEWLRVCQREHKTVFEGWTHALSYLPKESLPYQGIDFLNFREKERRGWFAGFTRSDLKPLIREISKNGPCSIRSVSEGEKIEKTHLWGTQKKQKLLLEFGFYTGDFAIVERQGMLKIYDVFENHFGSDIETLVRQVAPSALLYEKCWAEYLLGAALKSQGLVTLNSACHLRNNSKAVVKLLIEEGMKSGELTPVQICGGKPTALRSTGKTINVSESVFFARTSELEVHKTFEFRKLAHILSPFDPLVIQRERTLGFFGLDYIFEAYVPPAKRQFGYFCLPVLIADKMVALLDLKSDRKNKKLLIQSWHWLPGGKSAENKKLIEEKMTEFAEFQFEPRPD
jgi:uncharacterized protein